MKPFVPAPHLSHVPGLLSNRGKLCKGHKNKEDSLKVAVIREEFVTLTNDSRMAVVLGHLVEESSRVPDFNLFIEEETSSLETASPPTDQPTFQHGWFCKTIQELLDETLLHVTGVTFRRYLNFLVGRGWVRTRTNPRNRWDRRTQYRVNLRKLCADLQKRGYTLSVFESYESLFHSQKECSEKGALSKPCLPSETETSSLKERPL
ncbi:MAG: hypothetical protein ACD_16C00030G0001 [uncultured bacterium]|nr:MAG: hypothetical protein ACD_16C00030G0001 [uncultured bacterium]OFW81728.1 MAG: hypothetical protein A3E50_07055 [Alphaproteobacteria bacterium RIFCSPHIGHO2_12_FULL_42_100]OFW85485.1 MAG: hypothetical protein A2W06_04785 [Alphaproteobacteria bacterium RBG_16_42_14]OFW90720.1 MAG: hypothetical protein A3C41_05445 [Alphaproteobacteria bacterium RIFCSPHIGHO2_02_FULL_42_30]OFW92723.1 MAG: hypothetical protein A2W46_01235 [Alphaproteobacteria bacterium RIFCSPHIGHO2_12_42_13]OFX04432.1 MAG: hyp